MGLKIIKSTRGNLVTKYTDGHNYFHEYSRIEDYLKGKIRLIESEISLLQEIIKKHWQTISDARVMQDICDDFYEKQGREQ